MIFLAAACFVVGLLIGSFLNVVIWRVPRGSRSSARRRTARAAATPIRPRDNIPVVSWLLLRGRCRDCGAPISARYPLVELATAAVFVVLARAASARRRSCRRSSTSARSAWRSR